MWKKYRDIIILLLFLILIFQLYLYTTFPAFKSDSPETITAAYTLGISHPPGYPLYTLAAKIFYYLPFGSPAFRGNLFAIFLAIIVLVLSYFLIKRNFFLIFNPAPRESRPARALTGPGQSQAGMDSHIIGASKSEDADEGKPGGVNPAPAALPGTENSREFFEGALPAKAGGSAYENKTINFLAVFIISFSYIFWNQAIEAKGGIYMLNLIFFIILLYLSMELFKSYNIRYLYLMLFVYGLSLANHWPSMIILLPVFGYFFFKYRKKLSLSNVYYTLLFLILGFSPYIYLPVRSGTEGIFFFIEKISTWAGFWNNILRTVYNNVEPNPSLQLYKDQVAEFLRLFFYDFWFLWILIFFGGYALFKKNKKILFFYLSAFFIIVAMVLFYNRTRKEIIWFIDAFLIPAQYILFILIMHGIYFILNLINKKAYRYIFLTALIGAILFLGFQHLKINDNRYNYIPYDYANNALMTAEPGSFYIADGNFVMPLEYQQWVEHKGGNANIVIVQILATGWGINDFIKKYGQIYLEPNRPVMDVGSIINKYSSKCSIYFSYDHSDQLKNYLRNLQIKRKGLLYKAAAGNEYVPDYIFGNYSYRGIFNAKSDDDKFDVLEYCNGLAMQAYDYINEKKYNEAIQAFKFALLFPWNPQRANMYCDIGYSYGQLNDVDSQIEYLKKSIIAQENFYKSYQVLGMIYYDQKRWILAKEMFEDAIQYGSPDTGAIEQQISLINQNIAGMQ
jgi:hypothetical protein